MRAINTIAICLTLACYAGFYPRSTNAAEPVVTSEPLTAVDEDSVYRYLLKASDADNDPLSWRVKDGTSLPSWLVLSSNAEVATVAGSGIAASEDHDDPSLAGFDMLWGVAVDDDGTILVGEFNSFTIRKIAAPVDGQPGAVTTIAGSGLQGDEDDQVGLSATFGNIRHIAGYGGGDGSGQLYIADSSNHKIRRIDSNSGAVTTLAGSGLPGSEDHNNPLLAQFNSPYGIAVDGAGHVYVSGSNKIRKIDAVTGAVTTVAGSGEMGASDHTDPLLASFVDPLGVAVDSGGNIYVADANTIRRIDGASGAVTTLAGSGAAGDDDNEMPLLATFNNPLSVTVDTLGNILVGDYANHKIRQIDGRSGAVTTVAGSGSVGDNDSEDGTLATFNFPTAIDAAADGTIYVADWLSHKIRRITPVTPLSGVPGNDDVGDHDICLLVSDLNSDTEHCFTLTVHNTNDPPQIAGTPDLTVDQDLAYEFIPAATDIDKDDSLTFEIINQPDWADFEQSNGRLSGTPGRADVGAYPGIEISVSDNSGATATLPAFDLTVLLVNHPPLLDGQDLTVAEDTVVEFELAASDIDGDALAFTVVAPPIHGALTLAGNGGRYTPAANYYGPDSFALRANDGFVDSALATFNIDVLPLDDPELALNDIIHLAVNPQSSVYTLNVLANDNADEVPGDILTLVGAFSLQGEAWIADGQLQLDVQAGAGTLMTVDYVVKDTDGQYAWAQADVIFE